MHGAGNDFIVIDGTTQNLSQIDPSLWRKLAHRQLGIGADQILLVEKSSGPKADFKYRIFNADGGEVEQCGNGSRCFVRFVHDQGLSTKSEIRVEVAHTVLILKRLDEHRVEVDMGPPIFNPTLIRNKVIICFHYFKRYFFPYFIVYFIKSLVIFPFITISRMVYSS